MPPREGGPRTGTDSGRWPASYYVVLPVRGGPEGTHVQAKSQELINVNDVALGHATKLKWNDPRQWIWSKEPVHEPLIDTEAFEQVQALQRARGSSDERSPRRTPRGYALRGIVRCGVCKPQDARQLEQRQAALPVHVPQPVRFIRAAQVPAGARCPAARRAVARPAGTRALAALTVE